MSRYATLAPIALICATPAWAETPSVLIDTPALHSIAARIMDGAGTPDLLLPPGASPHDFALRPSDAAAISGADLIFWVGPGLTPWLADPLATLGEGAQTLAMLDSEGWTPLPLRDWHHGHDHGDAHDAGHDAAKDADHDHDHDHEGEHDAAHDHDHDHDHDHEAAHDHDADHDHDHSQDAAHDHDADHDHSSDHAEADDQGHDHGHDHTPGSPDPHAWLDPAVATAWGRTIADALAEADPANAALYQANAANLARANDALAADLGQRLSPLAGRSYIVPHDAFQYFEVRFGLPAAGTIALSDAQTPSPGALSDLRDQAQEGGIRCILTDGQTNPAWAELVAEGTGIPLVEVDVEGTTLPPGPDLYPALISNLASAMETCLGPA